MNQFYFISSILLTNDERSGFTCSGRYRIVSTSPRRTCHATLPCVPSASHQTDFFRPCARREDTCVAADRASCDKRGWKAEQQLWWRGWSASWTRSASCGSGFALLLSFPEWREVDRPYTESCLILKNSSVKARVN